MLKKMLLSLAMVGISFLTGYATAQSYFINNASDLPKQTLASNQTSNQNTLSPSEFQSKTEQIEEKKNQALSNQLKEELAKVPPTPQPKTPPNLASPTLPDGTSPKTGQEISPGSLPLESSPLPAEQPPSQASTPPGPTPAAPPAPAPSQSQVYTGFQNSDQNQNQPATPGNNSSQPSSSGGWDIKY